MSKQIVFNCGLDRIIVTVPTISEERVRAIHRANALEDEYAQIAHTYGVDSQQAIDALSAAQAALNRAKALCPAE